MYVPVYEMYVFVYLFVYHTNGAFAVLCSFPSRVFSIENRTCKTENGCIFFR